MSFFEDNGTRYYSYDHPTCPICGGKIIHPHIGSLTEEESEENYRLCQWLECIDEGRGTIGYIPICKKDWFKDDK